MSVAVAQDYRVSLIEGRHRLVTEEGKVVQTAGRFLEALECRGLSPRTVRAYCYDLMTLFRWLNVREGSAEELKQSDLLDYVRFQQEAEAHPRSVIFQNHDPTLRGFFQRHDPTLFSGS